jgi:hypothetical protein
MEELAAAALFSGAMLSASMQPFDTLAVSLE